MLKKYLNCTNAIHMFLKFSLAIIMCYSTSLTLYLTMPPDGFHKQEILSMGIIYLENIVCSIAVMTICFLIMNYIIKKNNIKT